MLVLAQKMNKLYFMVQLTLFCYLIKFLEPLRVTTHLTGYNNIMVTSLCLSVSKKNDL